MKVLFDVPDDIMGLLQSGLSRDELAEKSGLSANMARIMHYVVRHGDLVESDPEALEESVKLAKKTQRYMDINRIERKAFREKARYDNATAHYAEELLKLFEHYKPNKWKRSKAALKKHGAVGIIHLTDAHFNELVQLEHNQYDFKIAAKRLAKFAERAISQLKAQGVERVVIAMTGDMMNSDRRLDELLSMATNRAKATFLAVRLLEQFISNIALYWDIDVVAVVGNESRVQQEQGYAKGLVSNSYDYTIFGILRELFRDTDSVNFYGGDNLEEVISVAGQNILLAHGDGFTGNLSRQIAETKGRYSAQGIKLDYVIFGHTHEARIADAYARGSSLVGSNAYSDRKLNLYSRASQNVFVFRDDGSHDATVIDLQDVEGVDGYEIEAEIESYNAKSASKAQEKKTILEIKI